MRQINSANRIHLPLFLLSCRFSENVVEVVTFSVRDPAARIPESAGRAYLFRSVFTISAGIAQPTTIGAIHSGIVANAATIRPRLPEAVFDCVLSSSVAS